MSWKASSFLLLLLLLLMDGSSTHRQARPSTLFRFSSNVMHTALYMLHFGRGISLDICHYSREQHHLQPSCWGLTQSRNRRLQHICRHAQGVTGCTTASSCFPPNPPPPPKTIFTLLQGGVLESNYNGAALTHISIDT